MVVTYRKGAREEAEEEPAHESYIGPRCSRTLPRVVLACSPFVYLETHSRCRFVSFRKGSSSAVAAAKADRPLSHESRSSFPGGIGRETNRLVSPTMVLKRLVILLPVLAHSPFVPRGAKGSCVAFQSLGAALLRVAAPSAPAALVRVAAGAQVEGRRRHMPSFPPRRSISRPPVSVVVVVPYSLRHRLLPPCRGSRFVVLSSAPSEPPSQELRFRALRPPSQELRPSRK